MSTTHDLKTWPAYFLAVLRGDKNFEIRKNDRAFQAGDTLRLHYYDPDADPRQYQPVYESVERLITFVLHGGAFGVEPGYVVMGLTAEPALPTSLPEGE